jgi:hypothetical protein
MRETLMRGELVNECTTTIEDGHVSITFLCSLGMTR